MLPKILSQDSNYDEWCEQEILNAYKEAAHHDDFLFGDYDYESEWLGKGHDDVVQIEEVNPPLFFMVHITDIYELKARLDGLKHQLENEMKPWHEKELAHKYLNKAIDYVNELQLY